MSSSYLVNLIPEIENKKYLELGIYHGHNFSSVSSKDKYSVDLQFPADFNGSTDDFFAQLPKDKKFDVIYIDACHQWDCVLKDFNNSLDHLNENGIIFVHDLIPHTEELTAPHYCGDGFKVLFHIIKNCANDYEFFSENENYGLSFFINPKKKLVISEQDANNTNYSEFINIIKDYKVYNRKELVDIIRSKYVIKEIPPAKPKDTGDRRPRIHRKSPSKKVTTGKRSTKKRS